MFIFPRFTAKCSRPAIYIAKNQNDWPKTRIPLHDGLSNLFWVFREDADDVKRKKILLTYLRSPWCRWKIKWSILIKMKDPFRLPGTRCIAINVPRFVVLYLLALFPYLLQTHGGESRLTIKSIDPNWIVGELLAYLYSAWPVTESFVFDSRCNPVKWKQF